MQIIIAFRFHATDTSELVIWDLFGVSWYRMWRKILGGFQWQINLDAIAVVTDSIVQIVAGISWDVRL